MITKILLMIIITINMPLKININKSNNIKTLHTILMKKITTQVIITNRTTKIHITILTTIMMILIIIMMIIINMLMKMLVHNQTTIKEIDITTQIKMVTTSSQILRCKGIRTKIIDIDLKLVDNV